MTDRAAALGRAFAQALLIVAGLTMAVASAQAPPAGQAPSTQPDAHPLSDSLQTEAGRQRLIEIIKQEALEYQAKNPPATGAATLEERSPLPRAQTQPTSTAPTTAGAPGCGPATTAGVDLTPPPPDQPQPKVVLKQTTVVNDDVWTGQQATFEYDISNEGQGPLAIRLRGG